MFCTPVTSLMMGGDKRKHLQNCRTSSLYLLRRITYAIHCLRCQTYNSEEEAGGGASQDQEDEADGFSQILASLSLLMFNLRLEKWHLIVRVLRITLQGLVPSLLAFLDLPLGYTTCLCGISCFFIGFDVPRIARMSRD